MNIVWFNNENNKVKEFQILINEINRFIKNNGNTIQIMKMNARV
jgi:hypothetical protein